MRLSGLITCVLHKRHHWHRSQAMPGYFTCSRCRMRRKELPDALLSDEIRIE